MLFANGACNIGSAYPMEKRRSKRTAMTDRGMVSLLAAVEVASNNSPPPSDQPAAPNNSPTPSTRNNARPPSRTAARTAAAAATSAMSASSPDEPRKGARVFSAEERVTLDAEYTRNKFPTRLMMANIAQRLSKPPEKVRTWFNNRRALDRKMGIDVVRQSVNSRLQHTQKIAAPVQQTTSAAVATAAVVASTPQRIEKPKQRLTAVLAPVPPIVLTPDTPRWSSKSSPVTATRRMSNVTPAQPDITPSRNQTPRGGSSRRLTPVRLRSARLRLGQTELRGEGHKDEVGLEVKFLFGKRRLVYEWYCGSNFADAAVTGGPYAKLEINFDSLFSMRFVRTRDGSIIEMSLSDPPALYRQTEHNMLKFKVRSQQRQYQKASPDRFTEDVAAKDHCIHLRSDEAARVKKTILEAVPELALLVQESTPRQVPVIELATYQNDRLTDSESVSGGARTEPVTPAAHSNMKLISTTRRSDGIEITPVPVGSPSEPSSYKSDVRPSPSPKQNATTKHASAKNSEQAKDAITKPQADSSRQTPVPSSRGHVWETPTRSNLRSNSLRSQLVLCSNGTNPRSASGPGNAAFLIPTPAPWQSPATPFSSEVRGTNVNYWLASGGQGVGMTPLAERPGSTPLSGPLVRRALDFTPNRGGNANGTPGPSRKRRLELNDENDASLSNKKSRLANGTPSPVARSSVMPPPPMPPPLPPPPPPPLPSKQQQPRPRQPAKPAAEPSSADKMTDKSEPDSTDSKPTDEASEGTEAAETAVKVRC